MPIRKGSLQLVRTYHETFHGLASAELGVADIYRPRLENLRRLYLSGLEIKKAARRIFEEFKKNQPNASRPWRSSPRGFSGLDVLVAQEALQLLQLRNLIMRDPDQGLYLLTTLGRATEASDLFERIVDRAFVSQLEEIIDPELTRSCLDKSYEDAIRSAFLVLEVRVRARINGDPDLVGTALMDEAFNKDRGKLLFGETSSEREAVHQLFRSAYMMLRNPPSHRYLEEFAGAEIVEIIMFVDFLLKVLSKAQDRTT